jgi:hypothetical protein
VLIGLANHTGPTARGLPLGLDADPLHLPVRADLQTALDRLEQTGIIRTCDPAVVAAKIKRADRRPQGLDLAMRLVRDDLDDEDLAALERQFPGLTARVVAERTATA